MRWAVNVRRTPAPLIIIEWRATVCLCFHYISILIHNFKPPAACVVSPPLCVSPADLASVWALPLLSLRSIPRKRKLIQDQRNTGTGIGVHTQHRKFFSDEEKRHRADTKKATERASADLSISPQQSARDFDTRRNRAWLTLYTYIATYLTFFMDTEFEAVSHIMCSGGIVVVRCTAHISCQQERVLLGGSYSPEWIQQSAYYSLVVHNWRGR